MKFNAMTVVGAICTALALMAPGANAGFITDDYILAPLISEAEITPPDSADGAAVAQADSVLGSIALNGQFACYSQPEVYQGMPDGSFKKLKITTYDNVHIVAELADYKPNVTYKFGVNCWYSYIWRVATIDVTTPAGTEQ